MSVEAHQYSTRLAALACNENISILEANYIQHATAEGPDEGDCEQVGQGIGQTRTGYIPGGQPR